MIYRINFVSEINDKHLRRFVISLTTPVLFIFNCVLSTVILTLAIPVSWYTNNKELFESVKLRWNTEKE